MEIGEVQLMVFKKETIHLDINQLRKLTTDCKHTRQWQKSNSTVQESGGKLQKAKLYKSKGHINYGAGLCGQTKRNKADYMGTGIVETWNGAV